MPLTRPLTGVKLNLPARLLAVAGIAAVAMILVGVAALTAVNPRQTSTRLDSLSRATAVGDSYNRMLASVATAMGHSQQFAATGDPAQAALLLESIKEAFAADADVKALGDDRDRARLLNLEET